MSQPDTRERILDAAERLFAERGFAATSLRRITSEAQVNLAAVNYHFGSKDALIEAVFARRLDPLNRERIQRLERLDPAAPPLEAIVEAFVGPALRIGFDPAAGGASFMRLLGRTLGEPSERVNRIFYARFGEVARHFPAAMQRALPDLPRVELGWRILFMIGAMAHAMAHARSEGHPFRELFDDLDERRTLDRLVAFLVAGLRAPVPASCGGGGR